MDLVVTMPDFRTLFPHFGKIGKKYIKKTLKKMYLRDCVLILSQVSNHYFKYCVFDYDNQNSYDIYRERCLELIDETILNEIKNRENINKKKFFAIFPELSILNLFKLCFKYCNNKDHTKDKDFSKNTLHNIGKLLLIENSLMFENQHNDELKESQEATIDLVVNFTKQMIADENYSLIQKFYQNYFIFNYLKAYKNYFDIEDIFIKKYGLSVYEYSALLFLLSSQFLPKKDIEDDYNIKHLNKDIGFSGLKDNFKKELLDNLIMDNKKTKRINKSFFNVVDFMKKPLIKLDDHNTVALSAKRLFLGLTDSVYFDILDYLPSKTIQDDFSKYFGLSIEDYFKDIISNIDNDPIFEFEYGKDRIKTPDAILIQNNCLIFFECKKRPFHNINFLTDGNSEMFFKRVEEFYHEPFEQLCKRIKDFRNGKFTIRNIDKNTTIYPVIIYHSIPPIFSGAWDKFNFDSYISNNISQNDKKIMRPEFIDLAELEILEEYLRNNKNQSFIDLIKLKSNDKTYHNGNWSTIIYKYNIPGQNKRLSKKYLDISSNFKDVLFKNLT